MLSDASQTTDADVEIVSPYNWEIGPRVNGKPTIQRDPRITRWRLAEAQGWRCCYCGCRMEPAQHGLLNWFSVTRDHVVPKNRGGIRRFENLIAACALCNTH